MPEDISQTRSGLSENDVPLRAVVSLTVAGFALTSSSPASVSGRSLTKCRPWNRNRIPNGR